MRTIRLARLAMEAEALRWRCLGSRLAIRVLFAVVALFFAAGAVVFAHVAGWIWLTQSVARPQLTAAGSLAAADVVLAALFTFLAARSSPGRGELEALALRREALSGMTSAYNSALLLGTLLRWISAMRKGREA